MTRDEATGEQTLPFVVLPEDGGESASQLLLTVVFHPDPARIGETAVLRPRRAGQTMLLGRQQPLFRHPVSSQPLSVPAEERPLADPYVSRSALTLKWRGGSLWVQRGHGDARCRLAGTELATGVGLDPGVLRCGVPIWLGHSVVLLLRLVEVREPPRVPSGRCEMIGSSDYSLRLREQIASVATSDLDALILGETGTGKELVAKAVHAGSARAAGRLVSVNLAAIPEALAPAALFGSVRGAFTGADRARRGYFDEAEGGTLFLDEVGDLSPEVQPQLLRALQQREIQVVGGPVRQADVRVISATDVRVDDDRSDFRAALRHRLGALEIILKPLREHAEDIGELLWHFLGDELQRAGRGNLLLGPDSSPMDVARWADFFHRCVLYDWPGNVRELMNRARQVAMASGDRLDPPPAVYAALAQRREGPTPGGDSGSVSLQPMAAVGEAEFARVWEEERFEVAAVARRLRVSRQAVYRRAEDSPACRMATDVGAEELASALAASGGDLRRAALGLRVSGPGLQARARQLGIDPGLRR